MASYNHTSLRPCTPGSQLCCRSHSYLVQSFLGEGTFGKVAKCIRMDTNKAVAVKVIKSKTSIQKARLEVVILETLSALVPYSAPLLHLNHSFMDRGHLCLEFDLLDMDLWNFMKQRHFRPLSLNEMRPIVLQLASGLRYLKTFQIIHADMKLENIMMVDHRVQPHKVKIIDFGIAHYRSAVEPGSYIQSLTYRSPEVILGLPYTEAIDMWSLGCVAACLFLGFHLFDGSCEYEMISSIVGVQGQPPDKLLKYGSKTNTFFTTTNDFYRLKTLTEFCLDAGISPVRKRIFKPFNSLDELVEIKQPSHWPVDGRELNDLWSFVELLKGMLEMDAINRITPRDVMVHQFFNSCQPPQPVVCHHPTTSCSQDQAAWHYFTPNVNRFNHYFPNSSQTHWTRKRISNEVESYKCDAENVKKRSMVDLKSNIHHQSCSCSVQPRRKKAKLQYINPHASNPRNTSAYLQPYNNSEPVSTSQPNPIVSATQMYCNFMPLAPNLVAVESSSCVNNSRDARCCFHTSASSLVCYPHCSQVAENGVPQKDPTQKSGTKRKAETLTPQVNTNPWIISWYSEHLPEFMPCMGFDGSK